MMGSRFGEVSWFAECVVGVVGGGKMEVKVRGGKIVVKVKPNVQGDIAAGERVRLWGSIKPRGSVGDGLVEVDLIERCGVGVLARVGDGGSV